MAGAAAGSKVKPKWSTQRTLQYCNRMLYQDVVAMMMFKLGQEAAGDKTLPPMPS